MKHFLAVAVFVLILVAFLGGMSIDAFFSMIGNVLQGIGNGIVTLFRSATT